jgi:hypothetical protein
MAPLHQWSVSLATARGRRPRWLAENGHFTSDPARALRLVSPEVAVRRVQAFMAIRGWDVAVMERFQLVPAPVAGAIRSSADGTSGASGRPHPGGSAAAAA